MPRHHAEGEPVDEPIVQVDIARFSLTIHFIWAAEGLQCVGQPLRELSMLISYDVLPVRLARSDFLAQHRYRLDERRGRHEVLFHTYRFLSYADNQNSSIFQRARAGRAKANNQVTRDKHHAQRYDNRLIGLFFVFWIPACAGMTEQRARAGDVRSVRRGISLLVFFRLLLSRQERQERIDRRNTDEKNSEWQHTMIELMIF
ncbi:hypothetical protein A3J36_02365 [Candidatus Uhrbacteria bacterium RIFCSPLOWO2_02_FULL_54_37]|uniref:Uncharacterized protein n=1 Tax=Candidatus Uhrbacteria bacterium RIFCSPLOWO2_02_FULL_54_37 TaxID=1802412 RepID=A0A1F7VJJ0_9BACT|nr:MAG: hypothetical protein A3J36_02365 [Candidatus Uhrbacteria bacterium RIFCSPLOWO2_02_FULL_54_37]